MGTTKQKKIARLVVENATLDNPLNGGEMLEKVRYSEGMQKQPGRVLQSIGVQEELKVLGFDEATAKEVVSEILTNEGEEARDRLKAAEMVFKVHGSYAPEKTANLNVTMDVSATDEVTLIASKVAEELKKQKT